MSLNNNHPEEGFNIKEFILLTFRYKYLYLLSIVVFLLLGYTYNKFVPTVYQVNSVIGPVEDRRTTFLESSRQFSVLGSQSQTSNLENDMNSLSSFSLVSKTIKDLGLEISYYEQPVRFANKKSLGFINKPLQTYGNNKYIVNIDKSHSQAINTRYYIEILDESRFRLSVYDDGAKLYNYLDNKVTSRGNRIEFDSICTFNETITTPYFKFSVNLNKDLYKGTQASKTKAHFFEFNHLDVISRRYLRKLAIAPVNIRSTLININFKGENLDLTVDFLNNYLQTYLNDNLSKKNNVAFNTINFIDAQISDISDSLVKSESELRNFKASNQVTDLSYQGQQALTQITAVDNEISSLNVQEKYYNYILDYFDQNQDITGLSPPSSANVIDPIMNSMILELLELNAERSAILSSKAEKSLFLGQIENNIRLQKQSIVENVKNNLNALNLKINELNYRRNKLSREISRLPKTELNMVSMQRQFNITDAMYTFLLQKRSEAAISMASNYPDYEILEPARLVTSSVISPKTTINYLLSLFIGFIIPSIFTLLKVFFSQKVSSVRDIERVIHQPILNLIYTNYHNTENVNTEFPNSSLAESFRNLRTNIFLKFKSKPLKVILVTSALPQDGKSFIAFNLATAIAAVGHKTIIIDCDLRKPTLHMKLKKDNPFGISNFMNKEVTAQEIIFDSGIKNLSYIPAGPTLPNAAELIEAGKLDSLITHVQNDFNYVIIDSTPTGLVSDAVALMNYASHILMVCRNNHTIKNVFFDVLNFFKANRIDNFDIVYNDLDKKKSTYGGYDTYYHNNPKRKK
ncbi:polysaccharide biosynthesis tyrosine autokinase [Labilibacter sediminis]|nr:polysaccharide biosynthesis tyrosine autokinase [Labilibacter sediminis]